MDLNKREFKSFLLEQGITHLFHANTVKTSTTFIKVGGLLSRGGVEELGLNQTPQQSDGIDKKFGVWNDIFLDSVDLHGDLFPRENRYGPVLFKFNISLLDYIDLPSIWVTKDNPIYWNSTMLIEDRYFMDLEDLKQCYSRGSYKEMITLRNTTAVLPFSNYLEEIIIDDPNIVVEGIRISKKAQKILEHSIKNSNFDYENIKLSLRNCTRCFCNDNYQSYDISKLNRLFT